MRRWFLVLVCGALLTGCGGVRLSQELEDETTVLAAVQRYYDANAIEEKGRCGQPVMDGVRGYEVLGRSEDELVLEVRYAYTDPAAKLKGECRRWSSRTFTVVKEVDRYQVTRMTGQQGIGIRINRMLRPTL